MSINRVIVSGNLSRDPEPRQTQGGSFILTFGLAVNDRRKNPQTGEWEDYVNWIDCAMFGKRAESVQRFLSKGTKVAVEGKLRYSSWEKDGQRRSKLEVIVDELELLSRQNGSEGRSGQQRQDGVVVEGGAQNGPQNSPQSVHESIYFEDEDIPF